MRLSNIPLSLQEEILRQAKEDRDALEQLCAKLRGMSDSALEGAEIKSSTEQLHEQKAQYLAQNALYDRIGQKIRGRLEEMETLLMKDPESPEEVDAALVRLAFLGVFVKRISNWMLLNEMQYRTGTGELYLSIREVLDVYGMSGAFCEVRGDEEIEADTRHLMLAFEIFELAIRSVYDQRASVLVNIGTRKGFSMRISVDGAPLPGLDALMPAGRSLRGGRLKRSEEDEVCYLSLSYEREEDEA